MNEVGCHDIKPHTKEYRAGLPTHQNKTSVAVNKTTLSTKVFQSDSKIIRGDIVTLIMHIKNLSFPKANKYLHSILELKYTVVKKNKEKQDKIDPLNIFKKVKTRRNSVNAYELDICGEEILSEFTPHIPIELFREGIMPWTIDEFSLGYSHSKKRIIYPHRLWSGSRNEYVGIIGRTTILAYEMLDIPKYYPIKAYNKSMNLYGLQENYQYIQEAGYVVVLESEKGVGKRHSRNDKTCVACCCHDLSDEQVKILIGLNVSIVVSFDQGIDRNHIRMTCEKFYNIRKVSYTWDDWGLLKEKESCSDKHDKIYKVLFNRRVIYDEREHKEYLKYLESERVK